MEARMKKRMKVMLIGLGILFGLIFLVKLFQGIMIKRYFASQKNPTFTVSTLKVNYATWSDQLKAVGSTRAVLGVTITTELAGLVQTIYFAPGAKVTKDATLVQLNAGTEIGQLQSLEAQLEIAKITYDRDKLQYAAQAVSKQQVQSDEYNLNNLRGQVQSQAATAAKKTIRAPFSGRLGISNVNPGQYVNVGDNITTLQALNPLYVDFYFPQQALPRLRLGQTVLVSTDALPNKTFRGKITTIEPVVQTNTRNVQVEATIANPDETLLPGIFATVEVQGDKPRKFLTVPQTAVSFNSYGDIVYVVEKAKDENKKDILIANQRFVTTGETRGEQITILNGLKSGDVVVTSGQLKLKNGSRVAVNNSIQPGDQIDPTVSNDH